MSSPSHPTRPEASSPPAWRAFVHLYLPAITGTSLFLFIADPFSHWLLLLCSAIPTYFVASLVHRPRPRPAERFTHRSVFHRAAVLFTYGRLFATPFNIVNFVLDLLASFFVGSVFDQAEGAPPRRSEFFVPALCAAATTLVFSYVPQSSETVWLFVGATDRAMYRAAYLALVDDVVRVLAYPQVGSKKRVAIMVGAQAVVIAASLLWARYLLMLTMLGRF